MRFDDRLSTVLGLSAEAPRDRAVQWRQLVELIARGAAASDPTLFQRALERIEALSGEVPDAVRAAASRAIAGPNLPPDLLALFVDKAEIAAPLLTAAKLDEGTWAKVRERAAPDVRALMDTLRPAGPVLQPASAASDSPPPEDLSATGLHEEQPLPGLFRWECGPTGEIDWVEGAPRAALIGRSVADDFQQRFAARLPFSDEPLVLAEEGALAGEWKWSGTPAFFPDTGRFAGYHGLARRGDVADPSSAPAEDRSGIDSNRLRELIHELRTPLTAILGFGEIIEGQILGPAHRAYRNRAGEIVRQARRLLTAVEDLDLAAKLRSSRGAVGEGTPVDTLVRAVTGSLQTRLDARLIRLLVENHAYGAQLRLERDLAERLVQRFVEAVVSAADENSHLALGIRAAGDCVAFALDRPGSLRRAGADKLLEPGVTGNGDATLSTGFALRLVRGLASIAGGQLRIAPDSIVLELPALRN